MVRMFLFSEKEYLNNYIWLSWSVSLGFKGEAKPFSKDNWKSINIWFTDKQTNFK